MNSLIILPAKSALNTSYKANITDFDKNLLPHSFNITGTLVIFLVFEKNFYNNRSLQLENYLTLSAYNILTTFFVI